MLLCVGLLTLLCVHSTRRHFFFSYSPFSSAGYPLISHFTTKTQSTLGGFNLGGINASGQVSLLSRSHNPGHRAVIPGAQHDRELGSC